ncbi:uncharacterized protein LOC127291209 [Leptopilina boulardi]|uniref:uncharacterized protein LOC127291209 n=1 Tax=Leptopilina boulardi TaxID=63433 RepID=UPI0021F6362F|nr:uncharacterized protein LOC127291209 [Leptopilina boulardi]
MKQEVLLSTSNSMMQNSDLEKNWMTFLSNVMTMTTSTKSTNRCSIMKDGCLLRSCSWRRSGIAESQFNAVGPVAERFSSHRTFDTSRKIANFYSREETFIY